MDAVEKKGQEKRTPSFGALEEMHPLAIGHLINQLIELGYLIQFDAHEYFLINLTDLGREASTLALEADSKTRKPNSRQRTGKNGETALEAPVDEDLYDRLVEWRWSVAKRELLPLFMVAHNATLKAVASIKPKSLNELLGIHGIGPTRCEKYGEEILAIVHTAD